MRRKTIPSFTVFWALMLRKHPGNSGSILSAWVFMSLFLVGLCVLFPQRISPYAQEGGAIETVAALGLICAGIAACGAFKGFARIYIALGCLLLAERELDSDTFSENSLIHRLLDSIDALLDHTILQACLLLILLGGVAWHGFSAAWGAWKRRSEAFRLFLAAGTVAIVAQGFEELAEFYSAAQDQENFMRLFIVEEMLEMMFSVGLLVSILMGWRETKGSENTYDTAIEPAGNSS